MLRPGRAPWRGHGPRDVRRGLAVRAERRAPWCLVMVMISKWHPEEVGVVGGVLYGGGRIESKHRLYPPYAAAWV